MDSTLTAGRSRARRALIASALLAAIAAPASAAASGPSSGRLAVAPSQSRAVALAKRNFNFHLVAVHRNGRIVKVRKFTFSGVPMTCDGPTQATVNNRDLPLPAMAVHHNRFHGGFDTTEGQHIRIKGLFRDHGRRVGGVLRATGNFPSADPPLTNCDTGKRPFRGHR